MLLAALYNPDIDEYFGQITAKKKSLRVLS